MPTIAVGTGQGRAGPVLGTVRKRGAVVSVQIPTDAAGNVVNEGMDAQSRRVFEKLSHAMAAAGGSLEDVMLVQVYIVDSTDWTAMHKVWCEVFSTSPPARATIVAKELMLAGMKIEIVAHAQMD